MFKKLVMLSTLPLLLSATACARNTTATAPPRGISDYCLIAKGISFSRIQAGQVEDATNKFDTDQTAKAVEEHDLAYERVCGSGAGTPH